MNPVTVTVDTNQLDLVPLERLRAAAALARIPIEVSTTTVNAREREPSELPADSPFVRFQHLPLASSELMLEVLALGEGALGKWVLGSAATAPLMESILRIIASGSFPPAGQRGESLHPGQRRQFRDCLIFEAHLRYRRDVFLTNDSTGFVKGGRREQLEQLGPTRIITPDEIGVTWLHPRS